MAKIIGTSGAWESTLSELAKFGLSPKTTKDADTSIATRCKNLAKSIENLSKQTNESISFLHEEIESVKNNEELGGWRFFRWIRTTFMVWRLNSQIKSLRLKKEFDIGKKRAEIKSLENIRFKSLLGAKAEILMMDALSGLGDEYTVFNDLHLISDRWIKFNGNFLRSAQIDHAVVSEAGIFIIETKQWSKEFSESLQYHNPYDQVSRAAYLCSQLLRERFGKVPVRSIIASDGKLPASPNGFKGKVLRINEVNGYISRFKDNSIGRFKEDIVRFLNLYKTNVLMEYERIIRRR